MANGKRFITHNPALPFIHSTWKGNPLDDKGLYCNLNGPSERGLREVLQWQLGPKPQKAEKKADTYIHTHHINATFPQHKHDGMAWLGHATFLIQLNGVRMITDPVFWGMPGIRRIVPFPYAPDSIRAVDYILLSHNHRDHADKKSMQLLCANNPQAIILTGLQEGDLFRKWNIRNTIIEAGWYQQYPLKNIDIAYLPARHWNRRFLWDLNEMLWGSFLIQGKNKTIYFGADSGYDNHFSDIGRRFGKIDTSILGCGAYKPEWFMSISHKSPSEAVQAFHDTGASAFVPMHIGTFDLSDEPISEPFQLLKQFRDEGKLNGELQLMDIGEFQPM